MRSIFSAVALVIGGMMLTGCCSMNGNCNTVSPGCGGGAAGGCATGCDGNCGGAAVNSSADPAVRWNGVFLNKGQDLNQGCRQCSVGRTIFSHRGFSLPAWPKHAVGTNPGQYQSCGSAVGSCASGACGCGSGGPIINGLDNLKAGLRNQLAACICGNSACQGNCGTSVYSPCADYQGSYGGGNLDNLGSGPVGKFVGATLPFTALRGVNHPYGKQVPHTADATVGYQAPGSGVAPTYAYPYYTTRGPRDFLMKNPPSIGR